MKFVQDQLLPALGARCWRAAEPALLDTLSLRAERVRC